MNNLASAWETFSRTGKITDYLIYKSQEKLFYSNDFSKQDDYQVLCNENSSKGNHY